MNTSSLAFGLTTVSRLTADQDCFAWLSWEPKTDRPFGEVNGRPNDNSAECCSTRHAFASTRLQYTDTVTAVDTWKENYQTQWEIIYEERANIFIA